MLCSMANSGCLLLSNSGSMLPHSVPCPPAFLYLQQVSAPGPSAPRSRARAPRAAAHAPHLAASAPPLVAPRLSSRHGARARVGGTAPLSGRGAWGRLGRARCRVGGPAVVWGFARNFFKGAGGGGGRSLGGSPKGGCRGSGHPVTLGNFECRDAEDSKTGSQAPFSAASRKPRGRGEVAAGEHCCAAARTAHRASGEAGHLPGGTEKLGLEARAQEGACAGLFQPTVLYRNLKLAGFGGQ